MIIAVQVNAQTNSIRKQKFHFDIAGKQDSSAGYAEAVKVDDTLYISGSMACDVTPEGIKSASGTLQNRRRFMVQAFSM